MDELDVQEHKGKKPKWRPCMPQIDEDAEIILENVSIIMTMDDHVHTTFCQEIEKKQLVAVSKNLENTEVKEYVKQCTLIKIAKKREEQKGCDWVEVSAIWQLDELPESLNEKLANFPTNQVQVI